MYIWNQVPRNSNACAWDSYQMLRECREHFPRHRGLMILMCINSVPCTVAYKTDIMQWVSNRVGWSAPNVGQINSLQDVDCKFINRSWLGPWKYRMLMSSIVLKLSSTKWFSNTFSCNIHGYILTIFLLDLYVKGDSTGLVDLQRKHFPVYIWGLKLNRVLCVIITQWVNVWRTPITYYYSRLPR